MMKLDIKKIALQYCSDTASPTSVDKVYIQHALLNWYREHRRMLPWRGDLTEVPRSAYGTWVSEVMLQQTRVETVIEYWNRWMAVFPDIKTLAAATPDEVNKLWAGLGYYRRAQMLLKGAIKVVEDFDGVLPDTPQELLNIPGIGPYTAGAIASIAYDKSEPLVDGNVMRVFSRLFAMKLEVGGGAMEKQCWKLAAELVPTDHPGDFNQALMELGATVCKPTSPDCGSCPLSAVCHARWLVDVATQHAATTAAPIKTASTGMLELFSKKRRLQDTVDIEDTMVGRESAPAVLSQTELGCDVTLLPRDIAEFPRKVAKKKAKELTFSVCVLRTKSFIDDVLYTESVVVQKPEFRYLFVRRPATGLLANQWEFPSIGISAEINDSSDVNDKDATEEPGANVSVGELWAPFPAYFAESLHMQWCESESSTLESSKQDSIKIESPDHTMLLETQVNNELEPILHIFSHQRHTMHISLRDVHVLSPVASTTSGSTAPPVTYKWMTAAEIVEAGITTGCKKILTQVVKTTSTSVKVVKVKAEKTATTSKPTPGAKAFKKEKKDEESTSTETEVYELVDDDKSEPDKVPLNAFELMKKATTKAVASKRVKK